MLLSSSSMHSSGPFINFPSDGVPPGILGSPHTETTRHCPDTTQSGLGDLGKTSSNLHLFLC